MRIALLNLTNGGFSGGYRKYLKRLVPQLALHRAVEELRVFSPETAALEIPPDLHARWPLADLWQGYRRLRAQLRDFQPDIAFVPTARWLALPYPTVVMVRNMEPLVRPLAGNSLLDGSRNLLRRRLAQVSCRRATRTIAVSDYVRDFITSHWRIDAARVGRVYHGTERAGQPGSDPPRGLGRLRTGAFLFLAGSIRPARGLEDLISAAATLREQNALPEIVIAGSPSGSGLKYQKQLQAGARFKGVDRSIIWTGELAAPDLAWCFEHCGTFVMTSRVEACPNLVLEALSHGAAGVSTDHAPMPEFFGPAALYYRAGDAPALARQLLALSAAPRLADELRRRALERARQFSWQRTTDETVRELQTALASV